MTWLDYYKTRLERLEKSGLKNFLTWDSSCDNFSYALWAKQYADEFILKK